MEMSWVSMGPLELGEMASKQVVYDKPTAIHLMFPFSNQHPITSSSRVSRTLQQRTTSQLQPNHHTSKSSNHSHDKLVLSAMPSNSRHHRSSHGSSHHSKSKQATVVSWVWYCCACRVQGGMSTNNLHCPDSACQHLRCKDCTCEQVELPAHR